jgi:hypothetical protein
VWLAGAVPAAEAHFVRQHYWYTALTNDDVTEKLDFARRRLADLLGLIRRGALGAEAHERQQLVQEFFFHLIGAADLVAQLANERRKIGLDSEDVSITRVANALPPGDPLVSALRSLSVRTKGQPLPADPYNEDGCLFRAYNYRHQATHRRRNPFMFRIGSGPPASLMLDPRNPANGSSTRSVEDDLQMMLDLIAARCASALSLC